MRLALLFLLIPSIALADWQSDLEAVFDIVSTFDELADWDGDGGTGYNYTLADQPKLSGGGDSMWLDYSSESGLQESQWIGSRDAEYLWQGTGKSLCMNGKRYPELTGVAWGHGPGKISSYFGDGSPSSGYETIHVFHMVKFHTTTIDLSVSPYSWTESGSGTGEYYLTNAGSDPDLLEPTEMRLGGVWQAYSTAGSLTAGSWDYGDNDTLGYETIYLRLSDDSDPDAQEANTLLYKLGAFNLEGEDDPVWLGVFKYLEVETGFNSIYDWNAVGADSGVNPNDQHQKIYGLNFSIFNIMSSGTDLRFKDAISTSTYDGVNDYYKYTSLVADRALSDAPFSSSFFAENWIGVEIKLTLGTLGVADGSTDVWIYDEDGTELGHHSESGNIHRSTYSHKFNKISFGGNRLGTTYEEDSSDPRETRYYIDDVIIDADRIGPTYFQMLRTGNTSIGSGPSWEIGSGSQMNIQ